MNEKNNSPGVLMGENHSDNAGRSLNQLEKKSLITKHAGRTIRY